MWTTLALMTLTMAPAQTGTPELKNARFTYGLLGETRKSDKFLPGDAVVLAFDIANMKVKDNGLVLYATGLEITKKGKGKDKPVLKRELQDLEATNSLGGDSFPSFALWPIPNDSESPGEYTIKLSVKDRTTGKTTTLTRSFEVLKPQLGFVQTFITSLRGDPVPPVAVPGQRIHLNYTLVGFAFDKQGKVPTCNVTVTIQILDADGKATLAKPFKGTIKGDEKSAPGVMMLTPFLLELNRTGKYKIQIKATDNVARKSTEQTLGLTVLDVK